MKIKLISILFILFFSIPSDVDAQDQLLGEIRMFAGNFAPRGWAFCDGQLLSISSNSALFSLLGTMYGGDGRTTFGLPDLRGRMPLHSGQGPGLHEIRQGQKGGTTDHVTIPVYVYLNATKNASLSHLMVARGDGSFYKIQPPYLGIRYIIATQGIYPSRY